MEGALLGGEAVLAGNEGELRGKDGALPGDEGDLLGNGGAIVGNVGALVGAEGTSVGCWVFSAFGGAGTYFSEDSISWTARDSWLLRIPPKMAFGTPCELFKLKGPMSVMPLTITMPLGASSIGCS